jgi:alpha-2-macroglobulin
LHPDWGNAVADNTSEAPIPRSGRYRYSWVALLLLNLLGLAVIVWRIEARQLPDLIMPVAGYRPYGEVRAEQVSEVTVELGVALDPATVTPDAVRLFPPVPGRTELQAGCKLVFKPSARLRSATRYEIKLDPALRSASGQLPPRTPMGFATQRLAVLGVSQATLEADGACILEFEFSGPVDPDELVKHLKLTYPDKKSAGFYRVGGNPSSRVRIRCPRPKHDTLHVEISKGLAGTDGPLGVEHAYRSQVKVSGELKLVGMHAAFTSRRGRSSRGRIRVKMNAPVDTATAKQFVTLEPSVDFTLDPDYRGFAILGDFKCGERYRVTLKPGLSAGVVRSLGKELKRTVWFPDKPKRFHFSACGGYLRPTGLLKVPMTSTNVKSVELTVERLYASNLVAHVLGRGEYRIGDLGTSVSQEKIRITGEHNADVETLLDLREITGGEPRGVYRLALKSSETGYWERDSTVVVVTGLGASARLWPGRAMIWATTLADAKPAEGVKATVYSDCRQPLGSAVTDRDGLAMVSLAETPEGEQPAMVVLQRGKELSYLNFSGTEQAHGAGCYSGRPFLAKGYEIFAFTERGAYRPGDSLRLSAFLRAPGSSTPPEIPLEIVIFKPGGRELLRKVVKTDVAGRAALLVKMPRGAPTGRYRAEWRLPASTRSLGEACFLVADYIPRTLRMKLVCAEQRYPAGRPFTVTVAAEHLFGDPAKGLKVRCRTRFFAGAFSHRDWQGYSFGDLRRNHGRSELIESVEKLGADGKATFRLKAPQMETPAAITAQVEVEVQESGGRALSELIIRKLDPWSCYLGVDSPAESPTREQPAVFQLAAVAPDGKLREAARRFKARLYRVTWSNVLRRTGAGRLQYDWNRHEELVTAAEGAFTKGRARIGLTPRHAGPHRLVVESRGACASVLDIYVQGPGAGWATEDPEKLLLTLDKSAYRPGETARLTIRGPFGGTALVCVETDRVIEKRIVKISGGQSTLELTVADSWRPNVYITAAVVRPVQPEKDWRPHRASGAVCLKVDNRDRCLKLELLAPKEVRPGADLELAIRVSAGGEVQPGAAVVLAAVDEGVLSLTNFRTPDPWRFFYATRCLGVRSFDMYGRLAPELSAWRLAKAAAPGGDRGAELGAELSRRLNPVDAKRVKTAVLWSGTLLTGADGVARGKFRVPEYVGELRVMATVAGGERFGSLSQALKVRSPLMARPSWPRFLAPGDEFDLPVTVFNKTGAAGRVKLSLAFGGPLQAMVKLPVGVEVPAGGEKTVHIRLRATGVGKAGAKLSARLGSESYSESVELAVRPACSFTRSAGSALIEAGKRTRIQIAGDFWPGTGKATLVIAASPTVELAGATAYLLRYPYGCVEQTASRLVPLIYLREIAAQSASEAVGAEEIAEILRAGVLRLRMMQTHGGGLSMWPGGGRPYACGSIYAADVLTEARKAGHDVPRDLLDPLLAYLQRNLGGWTTSGDKWKRSQAAYACYVLARSGKPPHAWLARLEEKFKGKDKKDVPVTARFHLGAAMLAAGQPRVAREFIGDARPGCTVRQTGGYLDSPVREAAIMLLVLLDVNPDSAQVPALAERLRKSIKLGRWGTTQDNSFALMALGKYARRQKTATDIKATATLPDGTTRSFTSKGGLSLRGLTPGQSVLIKAEGKGKLWAFWSAEGVPRGGKVKEEDSGLSVRRTILDMKGKPITSGKLIQGRLYRVKLTVKSRRAVHNLVVTDLLPAGLEIENPDLRGSARLSAGESQGNWYVRHIERRDDRMLIFADIGDWRGEYSYVVRAVTCGKFTLPAVDVGCMYDPGIYSVHGAGKLEVGR